MKNYNSKLKIPIVILSIFFGLFCFTKISQAATYYVSTSGDDRNAGTDPSSPWAHCPGMIGWTGSATLSAGDIVKFKNSETWAITPVAYSHGLTATAGVTYDGASYGSGTRAKLTLTGTYRSDFQTVFIGVSNVTFTGFEVDNNGYRSGAVWVICESGNISNITVSNCIMHDNATSGTDTWCYIFIIGDDWSEHTVDTVYVLNNTIYNTFHEGISLYPSNGGSPAAGHINNILVRGNTVYNTGLDPGGVSYGQAIFAKNYTTNVIIEFNNFYNNFVGMAFEQAAAIAYHYDNITIRYNVIHDNTHWAFYCMAGNTPGSGISGTINIYGNLVYGNGKVGQSEGGSVIFPNYDYGTQTWNFYNNIFWSTSAATSKYNFVIGGSSTGTPTINVKNNIFYSDANHIPFEDRKNWTDHHNNLYFTTGGASANHAYNGSTYYNRTTVKSTYETDCQNTDPTFKNLSNLPTGFSGTYGIDMVPNTDGLSVLSGSAAIDNGANLVSLYNGAINLAGISGGLTRPQGAAYDIGAYEYVETAPPPDTTPPAAPTGVTVQ